MAEDKTRILTADELTRLMGPGDGGDKTRVLSGKEAARLAASLAGAAPDAHPAPRFVDDKIVFYCANGHRIVVTRDLAGKQGKCEGKNKQGCGVPFVVPVPPDFESETKDAWPDVSPAQSATGGGEGPAIAEPEIDASGFEFVKGLAAADAPVAAADPAADFPIVSASTAEVWGGFGTDEIDHPTARLIARLWLEKAHGGIVEVHLSGGSVIMPEWYDPRWSCGTHAVFAAEAPDKKSLTLTAVAWDQIQKVVVRQVQGMPEGMFQG